MGRHWAVEDVRGVAYDADGRLWFATLAGGGCLTLRTRIERQLHIGLRQYRLGVRIEVQDDGSLVALTSREHGTFVTRWDAKTFAQRNETLVDDGSILAINRRCRAEIEPSAD